MSCLSAQVLLPYFVSAQKSALPPVSVQARYELYVNLQAEDTLRTLTGYEKIHIKNTGRQPLRQLPLRLYPNSYSSDSTQLSEELIQNRDLRLYFAGPAELGRISGLDFKVNGKPLENKHFSTAGEEILLPLAWELAAGDSLVLETPFLLELPTRLKDLGYDSQASYLKDWYAQVITDDANNEGTLLLQLSIPKDIHCWVDDVRQDPDAAAAVTASADAVFELKVNPHATITLSKNEALPKAVLPVSPGAETAAQFFKKLLPGPLAAKRPARPESLMAQMRAARKGEALQTDKPLKPALFFNLKQADDKRYVSFSPAIGYNNYDQWMPGILIHNYGLPAGKFNFLAAPLYSTGDHILSGSGRLSYTSRAQHSAWQVSIDASRYAINVFSSWTDDNDRFHQGGNMRLTRIVPAIRYKWYPTENNSDKSWLIEAKAYLLNKDTWIAKNEELIMEKTTTTIGELKAALRNNRALYPYSLELKLQGTDQFIRAGLTGNYFLNYDARGNGLQLRGFAGKFFYLKDKNIQSASNLSNYYFNLGGATGAQDFTYSDYFIGRNEYEGWMSQQMAVSDGFFKVSTPYSLTPVGQTDDWLTAINLTTDLPEAVNIFSLLPFKLPVRLFADFGTYSSLWSESPEAGRFLYDAGVQVSVLKQAVTVYFPLLYSKVYRDTYKSIGDLGSYSRRIRFSVTLGKLLPKRLDKDIHF